MTQAAARRMTRLSLPYPPPGDGMDAGIPVSVSLKEEGATDYQYR